MKKLIFNILICLFLTAAMNCARCQTVSSVRAEQEGDNIVVSYYLDRPAQNVQLTVSMDGGKTFSQPLKKVSGDVGSVSPGNRKIVWDVLSEYNSFAGDEVVFEITFASKNSSKKSTKSGDSSLRSDKFRFVIEADVAVTPQLSYGFMFGMVKKFGWYVKGRSDFSFPAYTYVCTSDGKRGSVSYNFGGNVKKSRLVGTAGAMFKIGSFLYPYVGAGYGSRAVYWEEESGSWDKVSDYSCSGVSIDAGVMMNFGKFAFSVGMTNTAFKFTEVELGVGVMF